MTANRVVCTGSFAVIDEKGVSHPLHVYFANVINAGPRRAPRGEIAWIKSLAIEIWGRLEGVNRIEKGIYQTFWGETLRSDDPDAP